MPDFFTELSDNKANRNYLTSLQMLTQTTDSSLSAQSTGVDYETNLMEDWLAQEQKLDDDEDTDMDKASIGPDVDAMECLSTNIGDLFPQPEDTPLRLHHSQSFEIIPKTPTTSFIFSSVPSSPVHMMSKSRPATQTDFMLRSNSISIDATARSDTHDISSFDNSSITSNVSSAKLSHDAKLTTALMDLQRADDTLFHAL